MLAHPFYGVKHSVAGEVPRSTIKKGAPSDAPFRHNLTGCRYASTASVWRSLAIIRIPYLARSVKTRCGATC